MPGKESEMMMKRSHLSCCQVWQLSLWLRNTFLATAAHHLHLKKECDFKKRSPVGHKQPALTERLLAGSQSPSQVTAKPVTHFYTFPWRPDAPSLKMESA